MKSKQRAKGALFWYEILSLEFTSSKKLMTSMDGDPEYHKGDGHRSCCRKYYLGSNPLRLQSPGGNAC